MAMHDSLRRNLSYLQGLLEANDNQKQVEIKAMLRLIDTVDQLVEAQEALERRLIELEEFVEMIDEDLNELELASEQEDDGLIDVICPECGEEVLVDENDLDDQTIELLCPRCHTLLELEDVDVEEMDDFLDGESSSAARIEQ